MNEDLQGAPALPTTTTTNTAPVEAAPVQAGASTQSPAPVPYDRFQSVVAERNQLREQLVEVASLKQALQEAQSKAASVEASFTTFRTVASTIGATDPEAVDLVQYAYGRLPGEGRPPLGDWLSQVKADPTNAPLALKHLITGGFTQAPPPPVAAPPAPVTSSSTPPSATASGTPATSPRLADADVARIRAEAQRTGDWSRWREVRGKV